jgi:hypothetical protein
MGKQLSILHGPWSHSRATACPRSLKLEKVDRAAPEPRPERFMDIDRRNFGSLLHDGADQNLASVVKGEGWLNSQDLSQKVLKAEPHLANIVGEIERRIELHALVFRREWGMEIQERDSLIRNNMLGHEMRLAVDAEGNPCSFDDCPPDGWRAIIDYAEDSGERRLLILDNKNRPAIYTNAELKEDEQLSGYLDIVLKHFPGMFDPPYRMGIYYFEFGYNQIVEIDDEQLATNVRRLKARAEHKESLTKDTILPEPGFGKCQYCDYIASCDAGASFMKGGHLAITDMKQAKELASWVMVEDEKLKAAKKALKIFTSEHGAILLDDATRVGHAVSLDGVEYDKDKTLRIIKKLITDGVLSGTKLSEFTSLDLNAVKKVAKSQKVDEALAVARTPKQSQKFEFFRPKKKRGVRTVKEGRKEVIHPEDRDFADDDNKPKKARGKVKSGSRK